LEVWDAGEKHGGAGRIGLDCTKVRGPITIRAVRIGPMDMTVRECLLEKEYFTVLINSIEQKYNYKCFLGFYILIILRLFLIKTKFFYHYLNYPVKIF